MKVHIVVTDADGNVFEGDAKLATATPAKVGRKRAARAVVATPGERELDVVAIVDRIHEYDNYEQIDVHVLAKSAAVPRIMLCLYAVRGESSPYLSSTDMAKVTNQLGVRIFQNNIARTIRQNLKFFTADSVRGGRGSKPKYKLNRQGLAAFERVLSGGKL